MKNSWKPLVAACVTMKSPTPRMMHDRLITMARFFAVRKRSAMRKFWDIRAPYFFFAKASEGSSSVLTLSPSWKLSRSSTITCSPVLQALEHLGAREPHVALLDVPELHPAVLNDVDVLVEHRPPAG